MATPKELAETALPAVQAALRLTDYNKARSAAQTAVSPLLDALVPAGVRSTICAHSEFVKSCDVSLKSAALSNFSQRLNIDTICWMLRECATDNAAAAASALQNSMRHKSSAAYSRADYRFGYPPDAMANAIFNTAWVKAWAAPTTPIVKGTTTMSTTTASFDVDAATASLGMPEIVAVMDWVAERGHDRTKIADTFAAMAPGSVSRIKAAKTLAAARGATPTGVTLSDDQMKVATALNNKLSDEAEPVTIGGGAEPSVAAVAAGMYASITPPDKSVSELLDTVMKEARLPVINDLIKQANEAARLAKEVEELKGRPPIVVEKFAEVKVAASATIPGGVVKMKRAYDVFGITDAKHKKVFDFEVPTGEWDAPHPYVPKVDADYLFNPMLMVPLLLAIVKGDNPWLRGHTGTGKTTFVEQIYARLNLPVYRVNLDSDITRSELVGRDVIKQDGDGKTISIFQQGIIPRVMQEPCALLLDEVDASRPDLGFVMQRLAEGNGFMLLEDGGKTIVPNPWFRLFATANTNGRGDETGLYTGTRVLGSAFVDRFKPFLTVDYMDAKSEMKLISAKAPTLPKIEVERIVSYAKEHRIAFTQGQVTLPCSPRLTVTMARQMEDYVRLFDIGTARKMAFEHSVANAADVDDKVVLTGIADRTILVK